MNRDLDALVLIRELTSDDFERFRNAVQILTSKTFIIRGIDKEREVYDFTIRNIALFEAWFSCMDANLVRDESLGVIAFRGSANNRLYFSNDEIYSALVLRRLYEDKRQEVTLTKFPVVTVREFQEKYNALVGDEIKKTPLVKVLKRLSTCKLVSIESKDYTDSEAIMQLYPSIPISIDRNALDSAEAILKNKGGADKTGGESEENSD